MKFANKIIRFTRTKRANKFLAILIVLAVVAIGIDLIVTHASPPTGEGSAYDGSVTGEANKVASSANNPSYVAFDTGPSTTSGGPPPLPTGPQTVNGITFNSMFTTNFSGTSLPSGLYNYASSCTKLPGAGYDAYWPGNLDTVDNGLTLETTTATECGQTYVDSGGVGATSSIEQTPPAMADWTEEFGADETNLVRYMLWWPADGNWPAEQEFDMLEGYPTPDTTATMGFHMTWHGNNPGGGTNVTVGHLDETGVDNTSTWYAFRSIWVGGSNGYIELLAGPNFNNLTEVDEITASQISSQQGGALLSSSAHVADWAVEDEGSLVDTSTLPVYDHIGGIQLYE